MQASHKAYTIGHKLPSSPCFNTHGIGSPTPYLTIYNKNGKTFTHHTYLPSTFNIYQARHTAYTFLGHKLVSIKDYIPSPYEPQGLYWDFFILRMGINYNLFYISIIFGKHTISNILLIIVLLNLNGLFSLDYPQTSFDALYWGEAISMQPL